VTLGPRAASGAAGGGGAGGGTRRPARVVTVWPDRDGGSGLVDGRGLGISPLSMIFPAAEAMATVSYLRSTLMVVANGIGSGRRGRGGGPLACGEAEGQQRAAPNPRGTRQASTFSATDGNRSLETENPCIPSVT